MYIMFVRTEHNGETHLDFVAMRETLEDILDDGLELVETTERWEVAQIVNSGIGVKIGG